MNRDRSRKVKRHRAPYPLAFPVEFSLLRWSIAMAKSSDTDLVEYIGRFLYRRLGELGVKHIFGVAGDYTLELL